MKLLRMAPVTALPPGTYPLTTLFLTPFGNSHIFSRFCRDSRLSGEQADADGNEIETKISVYRVAGSPWNFPTPRRLQVSSRPRPFRRQLGHRNVLVRRLFGRPLIVVHLQTALLERGQPAQPRAPRGFIHAGQFSKQSLDMVRIRNGIQSTSEPT